MLPCIPAPSSSLPFSFLLEWACGCCEEREPLLPKSDGQGWGGLGAGEPTPHTPSPHPGRGCPSPTPCPGLLSQPGGFTFCGHCSRRQLGQDEMLRECETAARMVGPAPEGWSWDPRCSPRPPGPVLPRVPQQLPSCLCQRLKPFPCCTYQYLNHLSVLPSSPCHSHRLHNRAHLTDAGIFLPGVRL